MLTCDSVVIEAKDLGLAQRPHSVTQSAPAPGLTLAELERQYIAKVLQEEEGKVAQAAMRLGIPRSTLYQKLKIYSIATETTH